MDVIDEMMEAGDVDALLVVLRRAPHALDRLRAAQALSEIGDTDSSPELIDAALADEDPDVRTAATGALRAILGAEHKTALDFARSSGAPELLEEPDEYEQSVLNALEGGAAESVVDESDLPGLVMVIQSETNRSIRLRAIHALRGMTNLQVYHTLGELALWEEDQVVKDAAREALEEMLGDNLPDLLASLRKEWEGSEEGEEAEDADDFSDEEEMEAAPAAPAAPVSGLPKSWDLPKDSPVMREESTPVWLWALLGLVLLGALWWVFFR